MEIELAEIQKLQKQLEKAELTLLKTDKPNWKDQQALKETLKSVQDKLTDYEALSEQLEALNNTGEKHQLFSDNLMEKFKDLQIRHTELVGILGAQNFLLTYESEALEEVSSDLFTSLCLKVT